MADAESSARDRVHGGSVGRPVVGDESLGGDPVAGEVLDGSAQEADGGDGFLVGEDFDVGQAGCIIDRDVNVLPADLQATDTCGVGQFACRGALAGPANEAVPSTLMDGT